MYIKRYTFKIPNKIILFNLFNDKSPLVWISFIIFAILKTITILK